MIFTADKNDYMTAYNGNCLSKPSLIILRLDECAVFRLSSGLGGAARFPYFICLAGLETMTGGDNQF